MTDTKTLGNIFTHMLTELEKDLPEESTARHLLYSHRVKIREAFDAAGSAVWDEAVEACKAIVSAGVKWEPEEFYSDTHIKASNETAYLLDKALDSLKRPPLPPEETDK